MFCIGDFFGEDQLCQDEWEQYKKSGKIGMKNLLFYLKYLHINVIFNFYFKFQFPSIH